MAPILDLGKYAKLKGVLEDTSASLPALAGIVLKKSFSPPLFSPYPWSASATLAQNDYLFTEIDCQWQIFLSLLSRDSLGLPLQPLQAQTHGQLVTLVLGCQPIAEGSMVAQHIGFLDVVMDSQGHTKRINISSSRSLIRISKVCQVISHLLISIQLVSRSLFQGQFMLCMAKQWNGYSIMVRMLL
jgi:hypothetical protein